jgi:CHASE3 domain sensor protein
LRLLETLRETGHKCKLYQASSSEMFGGSPPPQNESTPLTPRSPYACAKVFAHHLCENYREAYGMFICSGILFNHESPRRGIPFVTRKITRAAARISHGLDKKLYLGNLDAKRDWGFAGDYVEAMWLMLQQETPDDYVIATGEAHSVREALEVAFGTLGLDYQKYVEIDPRYYRPTEVDHLCGDASKAKAKLGWTPKVRFKELIEMMVKSDEADVRTSLQGRAPAVFSRAFTLFGGVVACAFVVTALAYGIGWAWLTPELERYRLAVRTESTAYASMLDEETGLRAYLLTGDPGFMEPYPRAELGLAAANLALVACVGADPELAAAMLDTRLAEETWRERWAKPVADSGPANDAPSMGEGKVLFDAYRRQEAAFAGALNKRRCPGRPGARGVHRGALPGGAPESSAAQGDCDSSGGAAPSHSLHPRWRA